MHVLSLLILSLLSITLSVFSQPENYDQLLSPFQVDSSSLGDPLHDLDDENLLTPADKSDGAINEIDPSHPTVSLSDWPTDFTSVNVADKGNPDPACELYLGTRDEGGSPCSISLKLYYYYTL